MSQGTFSRPSTGASELTVPHEWWPSVHLLKSFEAAGFSHVQVDAPPVSVLSDARLTTRHAGALRESLATTGLSLIVHAPAGLRLARPRAIARWTV